MAEKYEVDPNNEKLLDAKAEGESIEREYTNSMQSAINANEQARDDALGEIGEMGADGKWTEGSATRALADAQDAQTEFTIEKINQEKAQAQKDYTKEQSGAYTDWQKQSNQYGVNAEQRAMNGLQNSGYSESSQVSMYNQYQARITAARESYVKIMQDFSNQITAARIANNSALAQIYYDAMAKRLELTTQFAFKNTELLTTMATQKAAVQQQNKQHYMSVYNAILNEMQLAENARQHNETLAARNAEFEAEMDYKNRYFAWQKEQAAKSSSGGSGGGVRLSKGSSGSSGTKKETTVSKSTLNKIHGGKTDTKKEEKAMAVNMQSVLKLGYGPISAKKLQELMDKGIVEEYVKDGYYCYRKVVK